MIINKFFKSLSVVFLLFLFGSVSMIGMERDEKTPKWVQQAEDYCIKPLENGTSAVDIKDQLVKLNREQRLDHTKLNFWLQVSKILLENTNNQKKIKNIKEVILNILKEEEEEEEEEEEKGKEEKEEGGQERKRKRPLSPLLKNKIPKIEGSPEKKEEPEFTVTFEGLDEEDKKEKPKFTVTFEGLDEEDKKEKPKFTVTFEGLDEENKKKGGENEKRNWRKSLNIYTKKENGKLYINVDNWAAQTKQYINKQAAIEMLKEILKINRKPRFINNICTGKFYIMYRKHEDEKIYIKDFNLDNTIFMSGTMDLTNINSLYNAHPVISSWSFLAEGDNLSELPNKQAKKIDDLLGTNLEAGTCSEASMLLYLFGEKNLNSGKIKGYIQEIADEGGVEITGTLLLISSLKDPCSVRCLPMLTNLMKKMREILMVKNLLINPIRIKDNLKNIILLTAQEEHKTSDTQTTRDGINIKDEAIFLISSDNNVIYSHDNK